MFHSFPSGINVEISFKISPVEFKIAPQEILHFPHIFLYIFAGCMYLQAVARRKNRHAFQKSLLPEVCKNFFPLPAGESNPLPEPDRALPVICSNHKIILHYSTATASSEIFPSTILKPLTSGCSLFFKEIITYTASG